MATFNSTATGSSGNPIHRRAGLLHALDHLSVNKSHRALADADEIGAVGVAAQKYRLLLSQAFEIVDRFFLAPFLAQSDKTS